MSRLERGEIQLKDIEWKPVKEPREKLEGEELRLRFLNLDDLSEIRLYRNALLSNSCHFTSLHNHLGKDENGKSRWKAKTAEEFLKEFQDENAHCIVGYSIEIDEQGKDREKIQAFGIVHDPEGTHLAASLRKIIVLDTGKGIGEKFVGKLMQWAFSVSNNEDPHFGFPRGQIEVEVVWNVPNSEGAEKLFFERLGFTETEDTKPVLVFCEGEMGVKYAKRGIFTLSSDKFKESESE